ncbi:MAG: hypothetical protein JSR45_15355 [Proteobacteria bacterium]|nr:hypothetical protein [Pseudomonadota bacterium]
MSLPIVKCATEGFRVAGRNPGALIVWGLYYLLCIGVFVGILFAFAGPAIMDMARNPAAMSQSSDPSAMMALMGKLGLGYFLGLIVMLFMISVLLGGIFRAVLMPQDGGFAYLKVGGREVKLFLSSLIIGVIMFVVFAVAGGVIGVVAFSSMRGGDPASMMGPMMLLRLLIYVVAVLLWTGFSMSYPAAFMQNGVKVFDGWKLAGKNYWSLLLCYLLVVAICVAMFIALIVVLAVLFTVIGVSGGMNAGAGGMPALGPGIIIAGIVALVLYMIVGVLCATLIYSAQAAAYRELTGTDQVKAF